MIDVSRTPKKKPPLDMPPAGGGEWYSIVNIG